MYRVGDIVTRKWPEGANVWTTGEIIAVTEKGYTTRDLDGEYSYREHAWMQRCVVTFGGVVAICPLLGTS